MSKLPAALIILLGLELLATGCASVSAKSGFDQVAQSAQDRISRRVHWNQGGPDDQAVAEAVTSILQRPLTVDDAVLVALLNNRRLQATYEELGVTQAALVQAGLLTNPRFSGNYLLSVESGPEPLIGLSLAQNFADLFFIGMRKSIAASEFEASKARVTAAVLDMAGETRVAYLDYQAAKQFFELRKTVAEAATASFDASQKLFAAGNITKLAWASERAGLSQAKLDVAGAQATVLFLSERLNRQMGLWGNTATTWGVAGRLPDVPRDEIDFQNIERRAVAESLDLVEARARVEVAAGRAGMTKWSTLLSEFEFGVAGAREDNGTWYVGPSVALQIPIFDQGQARNAAAAAQLRGALQDYAAQAIELRSTARTARDRLVAARERVAYCREVLLPLRDEILRESQLQYNAMQIGVFQLLAAKREVIETGVQYIEALRDYWVARVHMESILAGRPLPDSQEPAGRSSYRSISERKDN